MQVSVPIEKEGKVSVCRNRTSRSRRRTLHSFGRYTTNAFGTRHKTGNKEFLILEKVISVAFI
jgi:hypothetical protein